MMLMNRSSTLFLTHVGTLTTVKATSVASLRRPAHITGIRCPHHWNTHM